MARDWEREAPEWVRQAYLNNYMVHAFISNAIARGIGAEEGLPKLYEFIYGQYLLSHGQLLDRAMRDTPSFIMKPER